MRRGPPAGRLTPMPPSSSIHPNSITGRLQRRALRHQTPRTEPASRSVPFPFRPHAQHLTSVGVLQRPTELADPLPDQRRDTPSTGSSPGDLLGPWLCCGKSMRSLSESQTSTRVPPSTGTRLAIRLCGATATARSRVRRACRTVLALVDAGPAKDGSGLAGPARRSRGAAAPRLRYCLISDSPGARLRCSQPAGTLHRLLGAQLGTKPPRR